MKKISVLFCFILLSTFALAQFGGYRGRLGASDQQRFDSYYERWQQYKATNNSSEIISMEKRMQDVMLHNNIPLSVPYSAIASQGSRGGFGQYRNRLAPDDQRRFDSYYGRWQQYKATNNRGEIISMEKRMQDVMAHYNIPFSVPYDAIATNGRDYRDRDDRDDRDHWGDHDHDRDRWNDRDSRDLSIMSARYGSGGRSMDVTERVQRMVRDGRLEIRANNDTLGNDPAPGQRKTLEISYRYRGRDERIRVEEGSVVRIP